jgi:hypothetical protein
VGYGPYPSECVKQVRADRRRGGLGQPRFLCHHRKAAPGIHPGGIEEHRQPCVGRYHGMRCDQLDEDDFAWLASLPHIMKIPGGVLTHAALHDPGSWPYLLSAW